MARYRHEINTTKSRDEAEKIALDFLKTHGFKEKDYKGEKVWKKGTGFLMGPQFIKVEPAERRVTIEAWIKWSPFPGIYIGEQNLDGVMGVLPKQMLKSKILDLEKRLSE